ncbi:hypothetical protein F4809DRAFT_656286 [Biscogniauxia mediterranea]|nr:hypothetical protein F4809DRAFT_656286 [Biscogniauxia mediterranea]
MLLLADPCVSVLGPDPVHRKCAINGYAFQQDAIQSCNGWQYSCFYSSLPGGAEPEPLYVHLSRRKLPHGRWETLVFDDYPQTTDDGHNTVQLGVCPGDGTIHLSYDHHCDRIRYRHSLPGVATSPSEFPWTPSLFTATLPHLPGLESEEALLGYITYPRFVALGAELVFSFRTGKAGLGDDHLAVYRASGSGCYSYTLLGTFIRGVSCNPYVHGLDAGGGGDSLYATWVWRGFVWYRGWDDPADSQHKQQAGPNSAANNHDICFAWSGDGGRTWRSGAGDLVGDLPAGRPIVPGAPGIVAFAIPRGSGLANQEAQAVDHAGGVHVLNRDCVGGEQRWKHYYRSPDGVWTQRPLPGVNGVLGGKRGRLAVSRATDALYLILPDPVSPTLSILRATRAAGYADYELVWKGEGYPPTEPLIDRTRLEYDGVLSVFTRAYASGGSDSDGQEGKKIDVVVLDFQL